MNAPDVTLGATGMTKLDEKTLNELKLAQARFYQNLFSSDALWNELLKTYWGCVRVLSDRGRLQPLAKRHERNPVRFCERIMGRRWFEPPKGASTRQVQTMLKASPAIARFLTMPQGIEDADAKRFIKILNTLASRPAGRKRSEIYAKAMALRQSGTDYHRICMKLIPAYKTLSSFERRAKRDAMRTGVSRLQKAMMSAQGQTKSRR